MTNAAERWPIASELVRAMAIAGRHSRLARHSAASRFTRRSSWVRPVVAIDGTLARRAPPARRNDKREARGSSAYLDSRVSGAALAGVDRDLFERQLELRFQPLEPDCGAVFQYPLRL